MVGGLFAILGERVEAGIWPGSGASPRSKARPRGTQEPVKATPKGQLGEETARSGKGRREGGGATCVDENMTAGALLQACERPPLVGIAAEEIVGPLVGATGAGRRRFAVPALKRWKTLKRRKRM